MQQLDYPIRILERGPDDLCVLVPHDSLVSWKDVGKEKANKTRAFCNWLRKQFPDVPTEFRYVNTKQVRVSRRSNFYGGARYKTVNCDKHFVAYGLTKNQMLMVKLAWQFETQLARKESSPSDPKAYTIKGIKPFKPTDVLQARLDNKTKVKPVKAV